MEIGSKKKAGMQLRSRVLAFFVLAASLAIVLGQLGPSWAQPWQNNLRDTIPTRMPTSTRGPTSTPSPTPGPCVGRVLLREGVGGYEGTSDTWIYAYNPNFPQPLDGGLRVKGGEAKATLIRFEIQGVPSGAEIIKAELLFYVDYTSDTRSLDVAAFRVLRPWSESFASWRDAETGVPWATAGCNGVGTDRLGVADDTITLNHWGVYRGFDVTESVRYFLQHPNENYGWLIKGVSSSTAEYSFGSSRNQVVEYRPILRIDYEACAPGATATLTPGANTTATPTTVFSTPSATPQPTIYNEVAIEDAYISEWDPQSPLGSQDPLRLRCSSDGVRRMLLRFDLSSIPTGARVISATLHLWTEPTGAPPHSFSIAAYRLRRLWAESTATWQQAASGQPWDMPGASSPTSDYYDQLLSTCTVSGANQECVWDVTSAVQEWVLPDALNAGFLLMGQQPSLRLTYNFVSSEATNVATRPRLIVHYSLLPTPMATPTSTPTPASGTVRVRVYEDVNRNGTPDAGEQGLAGVTVELLDASRRVLLSQVTAQDGTCAFANLPLGPGLRLRELNPTGYRSSTPDEYRLYIGRLLVVTFGDYRP